MKTWRCICYGAPAFVAAGWVYWNMTKPPAAPMWASLLGTAIAAVIPPAIMALVEIMGDALDGGRP